MTHGIHEIFASFQGEGRNTGRPVAFVRYGTCNLRCPWCDTENRVVRELSTDEVVAEVAALEQDAVVVTGGEPSIQPGLVELVSAFKARGWWVAVETNGLVALPSAAAFDFVAVSPKADFAARYDPEKMLRRADEVRIVCASPEVISFAQRMRERIEARYWYLSPLEEAGKMNVETTLRALAELNAQREKGQSPWSLSLQTHKLVGIR